MNGTWNEIRRRAQMVLGTASLGVALLLSSTAQVSGQVGVGAAECPGGADLQGTIGISSFECQNCRLYSSGEERVWNFSSEPVVRAVRSGSPADGKIREGDEIVAIDGHLITTGEGGRRLANLEPGREISIVVRSGNRERTVELSAVGECPQPGAYAEAPVLAAAPAKSAAPAPAAAVSSGVPRAAVAPRPAAQAPGSGVALGAVPRPTYTLLPSGWFGFGIQCTNCRWSVDEATGQSEWNFSTPPEISSVQEESPAAAAGLRRGDVLTEIDGESLVSREGGRRFGSVKPGETVRWTYRRGGQTRTATATAGRRPDMPPPPPALPPGAEPTVYSGQLARGFATEGVSKLRYSGLVGETSVEVRGTGSVVVNIIEPGREIEIVTSDSRTRIRLDDSN